MAITRCQNCGKKFNIPEEKVEQVTGKAITCKKCNSKFIITIETETDAPLKPELANSETVSAPVNVEKSEIATSPTNSVTSEAKATVAPAVTTPATGSNMDYGTT